MVAFRDSGPLIIARVGARAACDGDLVIDVTGY
jgi:hypothetical protein